MTSTLARSVTTPLAALAMLAGGALSAAGTAHADTAPQTKSLIFGVFNASSRPITFNGYSTGAAQGPAAGTVLKPGESTNFSIADGYPKANTVDATFTSDNNHHYTTEFSDQVWVSPTGVPTEITSSTCKTADAPCAPGSKSDSTLYLMDPAGGPVIEVPAGDQVQQQQLLNSFCYAGAKGRCEFKLTNESAYGTAAVDASSYYPNHGPNPVSVDLTWTHTTTSSQSVTVTERAGINVKNLIVAEVERVERHEVVDTNTSSSTVSVSIPSGYDGHVTFAPNMIRDTGDFTLAIGNTTWVLHDVSYSTPDRRNFGVVDTVVKKMV